MLKSSVRVFISILIGVLLAAIFFACLDEFSSEGDQTGNVVFKVHLSRTMILTYTITTIRLTVKSGSTTISGPHTFDVSSGKARIDNLDEGGPYIIFAEALDQNNTVHCDDTSSEFWILADQTTNAGSLDLNCLSNSGDLYTVDSIVGNLRLVKAGSFVQGSPDAEMCRDSDEKQFTHNLTRNLAVMETEVTRRMWEKLKAFQSSLPADHTDTDHGAGMSNPTQNITWKETLLFANLLSLQQGMTRCYYADAAFTIPIDKSNYIQNSYFCNFAAAGFRLLSEGEWEYVCRAGQITPYNNGQNNSSCAEDPNIDPVAWYSYNSAAVTHPVATKQTNGWHISDLHGNVWEWCWDWYGTYPSNTTDYSGPASGSLRVKRGGGWSSGAGHCRSASRGNNTPQTRANGVGFRLARTVTLE